MPTIQSTKHFTCRQAHPTPLPILLFKTRTLTLLPLLLLSVLINSKPLKLLAS